MRNAALCMPEEHWGLRSKVCGTVYAIGSNSFAWLHVFTQIVEQVQTPASLRIHDAASVDVPSTVAGVQRMWLIADLKHSETVWRLSAAQRLRPAVLFSVPAVLIDHQMPRGVAGDKWLLLM